MENFIRYEKLGAGSSSTVYKGRRKGSLNYVAIICTDKNKRPEITNHVRLSHDLDHPNIMGFYEWYETSNHLWLVVELCTGGCLKSVISQDGCLPENTVREFGLDLVRALEYIHGLGIIISDLSPAKILLDASGILKLGNFCLSKAKGETLEDLFSLLSSSEEDRDGRESVENMRKRLKVSLTYSAPEVLEGSETTMSSDLWALGCILYYMYAGKPPFYSDDESELTEMILYHDPPSLRQTVSPASPPSEAFLNVLEGLLQKNPDERMTGPELLNHSFWTQGQNEEEEAGETELPAELPSPSPSEKHAWDPPYSKLADTQRTKLSEELILSSTTTTVIDSLDSRTNSQHAGRHRAHRGSGISQGSEGELAKQRRGAGETVKDVHFKKTVARRT